MSIGVSAARAIADISPDMIPLAGYAVFLVLAYFVASIVRYAAVLIMNKERNVYHQIPPLKAFLYALAWTPMIIMCFLLVLNQFAGDE